jgi:hypothetical protein
MDAMHHFNYGNKGEVEVLKRLMITPRRHTDGTIVSEM